MMNILQARRKLSNQILIFSTLTVLIPIGMYMVKSGLIWAEFIAIMAVVTPICTIYITTFGKYFQKSVKSLLNSKENKKVADLQLKNKELPHPLIVKSIIPIHLIAILIFYLLVVGKPLIVEEINLYLGLIESFFNSFTCYIIYPIFGFEYKSK